MVLQISPVSRNLALNTSLSHDSVLHADNNVSIQSRTESERFETRTKLIGGLSNPVLLL
jgi:hypothetical protein